MVERQGRRVADLPPEPARFQSPLPGAAVWTARRAKPRQMPIRRDI
jgi:hypothetical protein